MTSTVKDELSRLPGDKAMLPQGGDVRGAAIRGGLASVGGRVVVEAELDTGSAARRLRREVTEVFGHSTEMRVLAAGGLRRSSRYLVRIERGGEALARSTGLLDGHGRPVRGLPPQVVGGSVCDAAAAWRGAFLAHGSLTEPGRSTSLEITSPGPGGGARAGRRRAAPRGRGQEPGGARGGPGRRSRRRRDQCPADPTRGARQRPGLGGAAVAPGGARRPRTGWRTSTTRICAGRPGRRSPPGPG